MIPELAPVWLVLLLLAVALFLAAPAAGSSRERGAERRRARRLAAAHDDRGGLAADDDAGDPPPVDLDAARLARTQRRALMPDRTGMRVGLVDETHDMNDRAGHRADRTPEAS
jgi:hypothetical protein